MCNFYSGRELEDKWIDEWVNKDAYKEVGRTLKSLDADWQTNSSHLLHGYIGWCEY